jgi:uncharacterized RDD family membrane protein YckC
MKCPMCDYIGFEAADRCRNCGYEFPRATSEPQVADLAIVDRGPEGALQDIPMRHGVVAARSAPREPDIDKVLQNLDRVIGENRSADLPLFGEDAPELAPLMDGTAAPRRPLSVRRTTPDPARLKPKPVRHHAQAPQALELPLPSADDSQDLPARRAEPPLEAPTAAPPLLRMLAAALDLALLGAIDIVVVYFTLRMCGLTTAEIGVLPIVPLGAFFLLVNGGYLAAFTAAGGQTIGKMAFGLKVVGHADLPVSGGLAVVRALGCVASVASLGLGFLPALLAEGGRAFEDRLADTRVVRVTA